MSLIESDHWRCAILHGSLEQIVRTKSFDSVNVTLLPDVGAYRFLADPFGIWHEEKLYIFAEVYDYRTAKGVIDVLIYNKRFQFLERCRVLEEAWHLSYPYVFQYEGAYYMLPEGYKSGRLSLYRAVAFPCQWKRVDTFDFPIGAIDATPLFHAGRWWLFWTPPEPKSCRKTALHIAIAENLMGPWSDMGCFLVDKAGARPGGTALVMDNDVFLPVQDCRETYGGGLRFLHLTGFEQCKPCVMALPELEAPASLKLLYPDGMHTLSAAGEVTLVDVKKIKKSIRHQLFSLKRRLF